MKSTKCIPKVTRTQVYNWYLQWVGGGRPRTKAKAAKSFGVSYSTFCQKIRIIDLLVAADIESRDGHRHHVLRWLSYQRPSKNSVAFIISPWSPDYPPKKQTTFFSRNEEVTA